MAHPGSPYPPPPPPPPVRRGGGKAVPVVVGGGLAIGVFVGLLLIRGTGEAEADGEAGASLDAGIAVAEPDAARAAQVTPDAAPVVPADAAIKTAVLSFSVSPGGIDGLALEVDGNPVSGDTHEIELGDRDELEVEIRARARGYRTFRDKVVVAAGDETVAIKMRRRGGGGGGKPGGDKPGGTRPGGIIDL